jgi:BON domain
MIDRNERDRNRDREQEFDRERGGHRLDYGRNREFKGYETSRWENEGGRNEGEREGRGNFPRHDDRFGDYPEDYRRERGEWWGGPHNADYGHRGDWGRQGSWGTYGNRPSYDREDERNVGSGPYRSRYERQYGGGVGSYYGGFGGFSEQGRYAGRGPKNWQRSDERIKEDVNERLTEHSHIDATEIDVQVRNGEITISGSVEDRRIKRMVEDLVEGVSGVKEVHNQLRAQTGSQQGVEMATFAGSQTTGTQTRK